MKSLVKMLFKKATLSKEERAACRVLSLLRYNDAFAYYKCDYNDVVLEAVGAILNDGRDPIEFLKEMLDGIFEANDEDLIMADFDALRG